MTNELQSSKASVHWKKAKNKNDAQQQQKYRIK